MHQRGAAWCAHIETCCADMWDVHHTVAKTLLSQAQRVVDRFHVMKNLTDAVTKARRTTQRQADEATQAILKGGRWLLVKNREDLTADEAEQLAQMLTVSPGTQDLLRAERRLSRLVCRAGRSHSPLPAGCAIGRSRPKQPAYVPCKPLSGRSTTGGRAS